MRRPGVEPLVTCDRGLFVFGFGSVWFVFGDCGSGPRLCGVVVCWGLRWSDCKTRTAHPPCLGGFPPGGGADRRLFASCGLWCRLSIGGLLGRCGKKRLECKTRPRSTARKPTRSTGVAGVFSAGPSPSTARGPGRSGLGWHRREGVCSTRTPARSPVTRHQPRSPGTSTLGAPATPFADASTAGRTACSIPGTTGAMPVVGQNLCRNAYNA